ncbi:MAG: hypothetical protein K940chlam5_01480 [Candidatus Anoxychlamydiales bacterium]|nr:hypothetical protein [Candidatus Anoxychlamydiales bacterium]
MSTHVTRFKNTIKDIYLEYASLKRTSNNLKKDIAHKIKEDIKVHRCSLVCSIRHSPLNTSSLDKYTLDWVKIDDDKVSFMLRDVEINYNGSLKVTEHKSLGGSIASPGVFTLVKRYELANAKKTQNIFYKVANKVQLIAFTSLFISSAIFLFSISNGTIDKTSGYISLFSLVPSVAASLIIN